LELVVIMYTGVTHIEWMTLGLF